MGSAGRAGSEDTAGAVIGPVGGACIGGIPVKTSMDYGDKGHSARSGELINLVDERRCCWLLGSGRVEVDTQAPPPAAFGSGGGRRVRC